MGAFISKPHENYSRGKNVRSGKKTEEEKQREKERPWMFVGRAFQTIFFFANTHVVYEHPEGREKTHTHINTCLCFVSTSHRHN